MNTICMNNLLCKYKPLADLGGRAGRTPPYGTKFFHFHIHFHQKVPTSEVHTPPTGARPPPYGKSWIRHCKHISYSSETKFHQNRNIMHTLSDLNAYTFRRQMAAFIIPIDLCIISSLVEFVYKMCYI